MISRNVVIFLGYLSKIDDTGLYFYSNVTLISMTSRIFYIEKHLFCGPVREFVLVTGMHIQPSVH